MEDIDNHYDIGEHDKEHNELEEALNQKNDDGAILDLLDIDEEHIGMEMCMECNTWWDEVRLVPPTEDWTAEKYPQTMARVCPSCIYWYRKTNLI